MNTPATRPASEKNPPLLLLAASGSTVLVGSTQPLGVNVTVIGGPSIVIMDTHGAVGVGVSELSAEDFEVCFEVEVVVFSIGDYS